jgi:[ribosomal protein S18]-alanine N-acetyltransferase
VSAPEPYERSRTSNLHQSRRRKSSLTIRPATLADLPEILVIERGNPRAAHWSEAQYQEVFQLGGVFRLMLVAESGGTISGFLVARMVASEWEIENVAVTPRAHRQGIGGALVRELVERARRAVATSVTLEVRESNQAARRLYERAGFGEDGRRRGYYHHPEEDALHYALHLKPVES